MDDLAEIFASAGATGFVCAREVDGNRTVGICADEPVVMASVFKVPVLVELTRRFAAGDIDPAGRVVVGSDDRVLGPTGLSVFVDDVECSWRDLALLMMSVSDNTATDVIMARLGLDAINDTMRTLGLEQTVLVGDCRDLLGTFTEDTGLTLGSKPFSELDPDRLRKWRSIDPPQTTRTTPDEITRLLSMIWCDEAGPPEACAEARRILHQQVWPHRITSGFGDGIRIGAKTGTLPGIRNEAGVVEFPDGSRYAVGVFTRSHVFRDREPQIDAAIGRAARAAVEALRS